MYLQYIILIHGLLQLSYSFSTPRRPLISAVAQILLELTALHLLTSYTQIQNFLCVLFSSSQSAIASHLF